MSAITNMREAIDRRVAELDAGTPNLNEPTSYHKAKYQRGDATESLGSHERSEGEVAIASPSIYEECRRSGLS